VSRIQAIITDLGGVLTSPLAHALASFQDEEGIPLNALMQAIANLAEREGVNPLFELESGRLSEPDFLRMMTDQLRTDVGRAVAMHEFAERYWARLDRNEPMLGFLDELRATGYRLALLTNNVREWEPRWRPMLPVDELFDVVVDSAFVGMRKPERRIYELTVERLGVAAEECVFVDDLEVNCVVARELGMVAVQYRDSDQAIAEIRAALAQRSGPGVS
jgi:putative hydrolase of the HAD superfamily